MLNINKSDRNVAEYLAKRGITYKTDYKGATNRWDNTQDHFNVTIGDQSFDFYQGIGHRADGRVKSNALKAYIRNGGTVSQLDRQVIVPHPTAASVLYCLLMDSRAIDTSFTYWCDECGYSADSISAFNIYTDCCAIAEKLLKVLTQAQRNELEELLEDY